MNISKDEFVRKILAMQDARRDEKAAAELAKVSEVDDAEVDDAEETVLTETQKAYLAAKEYAAYVKRRQIQIYRRNRS